MNIEFLVRSLKARQVGMARWMALCPSHDDRKPSLSIRVVDGKPLVHCFVCDQDTLLGVLRARGLWPGSGQRLTCPQTLAKNPPQNDDDARRRALRIWESAKREVVGTPVDVYLRSRGLTILPPPSLRFHDRLKHKSGKAFPGMVALVTRAIDGQPVAIHRTFIAADGKGKAPVDPQRMMLGPCRGGVVRLAASSEVLMIGEGIETCLAAMQDSGLPAWAALSCSGLANLKLPADVRDVIVMADGDDAGENAARMCAVRWKRQGLRVRLARPPRGADFNDLLRKEVPDSDEETP